MKKIIVFLLALFLSGCDLGLKQMGNTEAGVLFRRLPPGFGGGVSSKVIRPGEMAVIMPWHSLYRFDTSVHSVEYGQGHEGDADDYVHTRALDGNEVALAVKIEYSVGDNLENLVKLVELVSTSDDGVRGLVSAVARAEIRTHMNELRTAEFFRNEKKYEKQEEIRAAMEERLEKYGINVRSVNLKEHRFERLLPDGSIDKSYQEKINEVQAKREQTEREKLRKATVKADKERELNDIQAEVNRIIEEAKGYEAQATFRADGYFESKKNEAEAILARGRGEVEGMIEQINALNGPGGEAILKLELGRQLLQSNPKFVLMSEAGAGGLEVKRTDTNQLLNQLGLIEGMKSSTEDRQQSGPVSNPQ
jgi:regulator of protease activity HflC (stomatin/prohibitin superfamily)